MGDADTTPGHLGAQAVVEAARRLGEAVVADIIGDAQEARKQLVTAADYLATARRHAGVAAAPDAMAINGAAERGDVHLRALKESVR